MTDFIHRGDLRVHQVRPWYRGPLCGFDLETTSADPETARIVGASVVTVQSGRTGNYAHSWVVNPGVPIEPEATAVHGITNADVIDTGLDPGFVVARLYDLLQEAWSRFVPVVIYNAPFDLTVLDRELRRHTRTLSLDRIGYVIDPFVLDKFVDPYRRGSRKLRDVAVHYRADALPEQHDAQQDALAAVKVAWRIGHRHPVIGAMHPDKLQGFQERCKARQATGLADYFRSRGDHGLADEVRGDWPIRPWVAPAVPAELPAGGSE